MERQKIQLESYTSELLIKIMSEDNAVAAVILKKMIEKGHISLILYLDDMNIRGEQIYVGYRHACDQNFETFIKSVENRSVGFVKKINQLCHSHTAKQ